MGEGGVHPEQFTIAGTGENNSHSLNIMLHWTCIDILSIFKVGEYDKPNLVRLAKKKKKIMTHFFKLQTLLFSELHI